MTLAISAIPAFNDNYIWLLSHAEQAWVVDPGDSAPVLAALQQQGLTLSGILLTHHHGDHTGGVAALREQFPAAVVYGNLDSPAAGLVTQAVQDNECFELAGCSFQVLAVPGHTLDHIAFYSAQLDALFCGDTLFVGGCGRVFEGTYAQMYASLQRLKALPASTAVYCAHEYTLSNLKFAAAALPHNPAIAQALHATAALREQGKATVPGSLQTELATNPFLLAEDLETFSGYRAWKNSF